MSWRDEYESKLCSYKEAAKLVESGDRLFTSLGLGEPSTAMMDAIADRKDELEDIWIDIVALFGFAVTFLSAALWSLQRGKG